MKNQSTMYAKQLKTDERARGRASKQEKENNTKKNMHYCLCNKGGTKLIISIIKTAMAGW